MKSFSRVIFLLWIWLCKPLTSQIHTVGFEKNEDLQIHKIIQKKSEYHAYTKGKINGYRIKIYFGKSKDEAKLVKSKFQAKFPDIPSYDDYDLPNFVVVVGNFKTKLEATGYLKKIKAEFPTAFIVKDKIYSY
ncbi:MAG: SPOR domain-containing protein [Bacteroidia bacterium]|nr:SPOR domain-containing protein [Bacteroidia bacterium]